MMAPPLLFIGFELFGLAGLGLSLLLPALVALYFLKLKRERVLVSSTFLWKRSVEDLRVNAPFQRLRRSLLLLLQFLALLALILAAAKPVITGTGAGGRNLLLLLDDSASMSAREEAGTRLELAKNEARALVRGMIGGDRMAVIAFSNRSSVSQPLTSDRTALLAAIDSVPATSLPTDLLQALRTAAAVAEGLPEAEVHLIGDGAYGSLAALPADVQRLPIRFTAVGKGRDNLGITEVDVRRDFGARERVELFASVANGSAEERKTSLGVYQGDRLVAAAELTIPAGGARSHSFDATGLLADEPGSAALLKVEITGGDLLQADDHAFVRVLPAARMSVLVVGEANPFLDKVLAVESQVDARRVSLAEYAVLAREGKLTSEAARVVIFDRAAPPGPPDRPSLYLGCFPDAPGLFEGPGEDTAGPAGPGGGQRPEVVKFPAIVDWDRSHPVNRFLAFADLKIEESLAFPAGRGYRSLIDAGERSIAGVASFPGEGKLPALAVFLGFDILKTNWPWLHSFPIFFGNALRWLGEAAGSEALPRYRTGEVLTYHPGERKLEAPVFRDPAGRDHRASQARSGELTFAGTDLVGTYELRAGGAVIDSYPVSLLSAGESDVTPHADLHFGASVVSSSAATLQSRDLWKWCAVFALAVILLEWWVWNRRVL
jgi:VWA domain-containing protein/aerotolerance regulator-like protein